MNGNFLFHFRRSLLLRTCSSTKSAPTNKKTLVFIAGGSEEMETVITVDVLRRSQSIDVTLCGLEGIAPVKCSRGVCIVPDVGFGDLKADDKYDAIVLPGGAEGAKRFCESKELHSLLRKQWSENRVIAAICAAPTTLVAANLCNNMKMTSHPSVAQQMQSHTTAYTSNDRVVHDGNLVTSQGPGTTFEFALSLVELLCGKETRERVEKPMVLPPSVLHNQLN